MPAQRSRNAAKQGRAQQGSQKQSARKNTREYDDIQAQEGFLSADAKHDIMGVLVAILGIALMIAVLNPSSALLTHGASELLHLGFGIGAFIIPLGLIAWSISFFIKISKGLPLRSAVGILLILVAIISLMALYTPLGPLSDTSLLFSKTELVDRGGMLGAAIAWLLLTLVGKTVGNLVLIGMILAGLIVIGFSISSVVEKLGQKIKQPSSRSADMGAYQDDYQEAEHYGELETAEQRPALQSAPQKLLAPLQKLFNFKFGSQHSDAYLEDGYEEYEEYDDPDYGAKESYQTQRSGQTQQPQLNSHEKRAQRALASRRLNDPDKTQLLNEREPEQLEVPDFLRKSSMQSSKTVLLPEDRSSAEQTQAASSASLGGQAKQGYDKTQLLPKKASKSPVDPASTKKAPIKQQDRSSSAANKKHQAYPSPTEGFELPAEDSLIMRSAQFKLSPEQEDELNATQERLQDTLQTFGMSARVVGWTAGPTVTTFRVAMGEGERLSKLLGLEDDIALSLAATAVRIFSPIPGTSLVGVEIPNYKRSQVTLGDVMPFVKGGPLTLAIGRDVEGNPVTSDLAKMPHLLIAGTTGSGKSVMINTILSCLLMRATPNELRLIMVDPKRVELSGYNDIPQLYVPVVTDPRQAASSLQWAVAEMERRLKVFEKAGARNIGIFNGMVQDGKFEEAEQSVEEMPYLVIVIDELTDLMMVAGKDVEASIVRIAQLGRAAGIHLIVATQRPAAEVVTNAIKVNIVNRIAFKVATSVDSRVILGQGGAEKLIGLGDMLYDDGKSGKPTRLQGCFVSDEEIEGIVDHLRQQGEPDYHEEILSVVLPSAASSGASTGASGGAGDDDPLIWEAAEAVIQMKMGSTSGIQRRLKVGYARAGRIMDMLEEKGIVGPADGTKPREVLVGLEDLETLRAFEHADADKDGDI